MSEASFLDGKLDWLKAVLPAREWQCVIATVAFNEQFSYNKGYGAGMGDAERERAGTAERHLRAIVNLIDEFGDDPGMVADVLGEPLEHVHQFLERYG